MNDLASMLIKHKIVHEQAIYDPEGFDGGKTEDAINCVQTILTERFENHKAEAAALRAEIKMLREGLSDVATKLGNGSKAHPDCSIHFLTQHVPIEVAVYCQELRRALRKLATAVEVGVESCNSILKESLEVAQKLSIER